MRTSPNIIITGTPGVGKTTHAAMVAAAAGMKHLSVNELAKDRDCYDGWDEELGSWIVDEDKLLDAMEPDLLEGGCVIDWHACDLFPESWIDLVVVIRCESGLLYERLAARGYGGRKLEENLDAEIMQVLLEEARDAYDEEIVVELYSDVVEQVEGNVEKVCKWVEGWRLDRAELGDEGWEDAVEWQGFEEEEDEDGVGGERRAGGGKRREDEEEDEEDEDDFMDARGGRGREGDGEEDEDDEDEDSDEEMSDGKRWR